MERVEITTSRLGDPRKLPKYGNAQLPGQHTLEVCFLECDVSSKPSSGVKVNTTKVIKSDCIVMVSEEDIQFVPIDNADMVDIVRSFVKGIKYVIKLGKIADISILQGEDDEMAVGAKTVRNLKQPQPRRIIIHLHCGSDCKIATNGHGSTHLAKQIQSAWQSTIVLRSAQLPKLNSSADSATAEEYLCETVNSLKGTTDLLLKTDIFDEFANEVWVDLQLKHAACNSRELFVSTIALCKELLRTPAELSIEAKSILHRSNDQPNSVFDDKFTPASSTRSFGNSFRSFGNSSVIGSSVSHRSMTSISNERNRAGETTSETQLRLQATALQRLVLVRSALKAMVAAIFSSESASSRYGLLGGPNPMTLDSWCSVLVPDLYLSICETFHCSPETDEEQVSLAMGQSLLFQPSALSSGTFDPNRTRSSVDYPTPLTLTRDGAHSPAVSTLWNRSAGDAVSGSVLAPYRDRRTVKSNELEAAAPTLADTRRGIKDLQIILMYELSRIAAIGYSSISRHVVLSRSPHTQSQTAVLFFGETFTHDPNWETSLEELLMRVSSLLDDMLCSTSITSTMLDHSMKILRTRSRPMSALQQNNSDSDSSEDKEKSVRRGRRGLRRRRAERRALESSDEISSIADERSPRKASLQGESSRIDSDRDTSLSLHIPGGVSFPGRSCPRTPVSSSFELGLDVTALGTSRASVPPSPVPPKGSHSRPGTQASRPEPEPQSTVRDEGKIDERKCRSPLETQEILLHYSLSLLLTMALDSAKVRRVLGQDLSNYWVPIMQILNTICPRPSLGTRTGMGVNPKPPSKSPDSRHGSAHRSRFSAVNGTTGKFQKSVPQLPRRSEPPGRSKFFSGFFQTKLKPAGLSRDATAHEKFLKDQIAIRKNVAIERVADDLSNLLLSDYGPPQYGISQASWTLLLMARRCAEELVVMLGLYGRHGETGGKTAVLFRLQEPTPTQIQGINRQEEEALRMGSSRSIRSDFPSARGRDRRDFRSWETNSDDASSEITPGYPFSPSGMKPESARMGRIIRAQNALDSDPDIDTHVGPDPDPDSSRGLPPRQSTISPIRNTSASSLENPRINSSRSTTRI